MEFLSVSNLSFFNCSNHVRFFVHFERRSGVVKATFRYFLRNGPLKNIWIDEQLFYSFLLKTQPEIFLEKRNDLYNVYWLIDSLTGLCYTSIDSSSAIRCVAMRLSNLARKKNIYDLNLGNSTPSFHIFKFGLLNKKDIEYTAKKLLKHYMIISLRLAE